MVSRLGLLGRAHAQLHRYCRATGTWYVWDKYRFQPKDDAWIRQRARSTARALQAQGLEISDTHDREAAITRPGSFLVFADCFSAQPPYLVARVFHTAIFCATAT